MVQRDRFPVVVHVLLFRGDDAELFLLRRAATGFMDGFHVPPGGHLQSGESLRAAAARECREEAGVTPAGLEPLCLLPYRSGRHQGLNVVFEGRGLEAEPGVGEPEHCDEAGWYPVTALPQPAAPWLGDVLELRGAGEWYRELYWP